MEPREPTPPPISNATSGEPAEERLAGMRIVESEELLKGDCEVLIRHGRELYRLRRTRQGKLILHK